MMAWLGHALKPFQAGRSTSRRSVRPMVRMTGANMIGADLVSAVRCASCVTLPGYGVAMVVLSLKAEANSPHRWTARVSLQRIRDHEQARRESNENWSCRDLRRDPMLIEAQRCSRFGDRDGLTNCEGCGLSGFSLN